MKKTNRSRKAKPCSAEVGRFASNPQSQNFSLLSDSLCSLESARIANQKFGRKAKPCSQTIGLLR